MRNQLLLVVALSGALPAAAQTGRIAQGSHAGRAALAAADDNLGEPVPLQEEWRRDSLVYVSKVRLEHRGEARSWRYNAEQERAAWQRQVQVYECDGSLELDKESLRQIRQRYPNAVFIKPAQARKLKSQAPAGRTHTFRKRPFQHSYWRGLAAVATLGAVGWLPGRKSRTV